MLPEPFALFLFTFALVRGSTIPRRYCVYHHNGLVFIKLHSHSDGILQETYAQGHTTHSSFLENRAPVVAPKPALKPALKPPPTTPQPVRAPVFQKLPAPYLDDAVDLCDLYIECYEYVSFHQYTHLLVPVILTYLDRIGR